MTNADRAENARHALETYIEGKYADIDDCAVIDLITDLLHYARQKKMGAGNIARMAIDHFHTETNNG